MKTKKLLFLAVFAALLAASAYAQSAGRGYTTREYPWVMRSTAALGLPESKIAGVLTSSP